MKEQPDNLDEALDAALATYSGEPESGTVRARLLRAIDDENNRRRRLLHGAAAALLAASVPLVFWLHRAVPSIQEREKPQLQASRVQPPISPPLFVAQQREPKQHKRRPARKLSPFPSPAPMTQEERALVQFVAADPRRIPPELLDPDAPIRPIQIAAVEVEPLH